ncbi:hypothetical protein HKX48_004096 [Thoreauomyces humboldtii]|nr:hypothetical protein HKX48_004096 [Thoreauomyces humboldtii]
MVAFLSRFLLCWATCTHVFGTFAKAQSPAVLATLTTDWPAPPLLLEAIEYLGQERNVSIFEFLTYLDESNLLVRSAQQTPEHVYNSIVDALTDNLDPVDQALGKFESMWAAHEAPMDAGIAELLEGAPVLQQNSEWPRFLTSSSMPFLKLALATHSNAPRVQSHYQLYATDIVPKFTSVKGKTTGSSFNTSCESWVDWYGSQICAPEELLKSVEAFANRRKDEVSSQIYAFDHVHRVRLSHDETVAILYADVQSPSFAIFHKVLIALADKHAVTYVLRYKPGSGPRTPLSVSGYGVELALKSTEYKVVDDRDTHGQKDAPTINRSEQNAELQEDPPRIVPLTSNQTQGKRPMNPARRVWIANPAENPLLSLRDISQNFPKFAHILKDISLDAELADKVAANQRKMPGMRNRIWINGFEQELTKLDIFNLQKTLRAESSRVSELMALNLTSVQAVNILSTPLLQKGGLEVAWGKGFDVRSEIVIWWNDLEKDKRYKSWPKGIAEVARPSYPGQLKYVRKNLMSILFLVDLTNAMHLRTVVQTFEFIEREIPLRFGVAPLMNSEDPDSPTSLAATTFYLIRKTASLKDAKTFILALYEASQIGKPISTQAIEEAFEGIVSKSLSFALESWTQEREACYAEVVDFGQRTGTSYESGAIFANGKHIELVEEWQQVMIATYHQMVEHLGTQIYSRAITDKTDIYEYFLTLPNVYRRRNDFIFGAPKLVDFLDPAFHLVESFAWHASDSSPSAVSAILIADFNSEDGARHAAEGAEFLFKEEGVRSTFLHNGLNRFDAFPNGARDANNLGTAAEILKVNSNIIGSTRALFNELGLKPGDTAVIINGRVVVNAFVASDFALLATLEFEQRISNIASKVIGFAETGAAGEKHAISYHRISEVILKIGSSLAVASATIAEGGNPRTRLPSEAFAKLDTLSSGFAVGSNVSYQVHIFAIVDPLSEAAQKLSALLSVVSKLQEVYTQISLNPDSTATEKLPITRFYRYVLDSELRFDARGDIVRPSAEFHGLPIEPLYTLGMDVPNAWIVFPKESVEDLDNIRLAKLQGRRNVEAKFLLENILVEGHARDSRTNGPPHGLQFLLGTRQDPAQLDTITMANLGYLQLKANPGIWELRLREGRSRDIYDIHSVGDSQSKPSASVHEIRKESVVVRVDSFEGITIYPVVVKKLGMEAATVLADSAMAKSDENSSIWKQLKSKLFGTRKGDDTINVFSVASGHLYERFLGIMMLSVVKTTKKPVKFWFISNFLSPSFKAFIPHLAEAYGFKYELVTYKWPHWLRQQTEKQRTIWGYKILFLDVLFPLDLDKVIFVDADQVVRADLDELVQMDLGGAVYGYTPFCSDRTEMDGFRFWKDGYWKDHLRGKPYHISALYVVDLQQFRQLAAGDRLRQQYQMLSSDPHSLANLDQDLPNNMNTAGNIPIHSLPQEWLWCETWCSDASLKNAKTIDLCNNPLTKEPKLERAKRILPEWEGLDNEVAAVAARVARTSAATSLPLSHTDAQAPVHGEL